MKITVNKAEATPKYKMLYTNDFGDVIMKTQHSERQIVLVHHDYDFGYSGNFLRPATISGEYIGWYSFKGSITISND